MVDNVDALTSESSDIAAARVVSAAINLLPNYPTATEFSQQIELPRVDFGTFEATEEQRLLVQNFFELLSTKMPPDQFQKSLVEFTKNISFTDDIYGIALGASYAGPQKPIPVISVARVPAVDQAQAVKMLTNLFRRGWSDENHVQ